MPTYVNVGRHAVSTPDHNIGPGDVVEMGRSEAAEQVGLGVLVERAVPKRPSRSDPAPTTPAEPAGAIKE